MAHLEQELLLLNKQYQKTLQQFQTQGRLAHPDSNMIEMLESQLKELLESLETKVINLKRFLDYRANNCSQWLHW